MSTPGGIPAREAGLVQAASERQRGDIAAALATLAQLAQQYPEFSRLHEERGHCHAALQDPAQAIPAYLRAVALNPALPASWRMLEGLYRAAGDLDNARKAAMHVAALARVPADIVRASSLFSDGELGAAEHLVRTFLAQHGEQLEALYLLGRIALQQRVLAAAESLLARVLALAPGYTAARYDYASALLDQQKYVAARAAISELLAKEPGHVAGRTLYATTLAALGEQEQAITLFRALIAEGAAAEAPILHVSLGNALKALGRSEEAVAEFRAAIAVRADFGNAWWSLANLRSYRFSAVEAQRIREAAEAPATAPSDRVALWFALGKACEDQADPHAAWQAYERGNALQVTLQRFQPDPEGVVRRQRAACTPALFAGHAGTGSGSDAPIFIVGLPRSGSTLLEQILASHADVEGTHELPELPRLVLELHEREPGYPAVLSSLSPEELRRLGERYLAATQPWRSGRPHFIDKLPGNFRHVGLIHLMLPNARIIDARREPLACCVGNFRQLFATGQEFTYSLDLLARYYRAYLELMRHWDRVLPGRVLRVVHEDVVSDLEGSVRRLLAFCGLDFDPRCLEFHRTVRSVRTASSEQVRQPLNRDGLDQWRQFEPWLGPLKAALGDALHTWRQD